MPDDFHEGMGMSRCSSLCLNLDDMPDICELIAHQSLLFLYSIMLRRTVWVACYFIQAPIHPPNTTCVNLLGLLLSI